MIVPNMSAEEAVIEARKDLQTVWRKMGDPIHRLQRRHLKGDRSEVLEELHEYTSPGRNKWMVILRVAKRESHVCFLTYYRGHDQKLRAAIITPKGTCYHFSAHIVERYGQRFDRTKDPLERIRFFFRENYLLACETVGRIDEHRSEIVAGMAHGMALGTWDRRHDVVSFATFINHGQLTESQSVLSEKLDFHRELSIMTHGQKIDFLNSIRRQLDRQAVGA